MVGLIAAAGAQGKEVFRYEDEDTGAVHYMNSLPEGAVEGGWQFKAGPEGEEDLYQLTYKAAKETGFVPEANYLPGVVTSKIIPSYSFVHLKRKATLHNV